MSMWCSASSYVFILTYVLFCWRHVIDASSVPPSFTVDLRLSPRQRWKGALSKVLNVHSWNNSFGPVFEEHNRDLFDHLSDEQWNQLEMATSHHFPDTAEELRGIADDFAKSGHTEVNFRYLCGWLWFHELAHSDLLVQNSVIEKGLSKSCTGIVVRSNKSADFWHGRNMDQSPAQVRNCTLQIDFLDEEGNEIVRSVDWYWITTGVMTALRSDVASLQENWRFHVSGINSPMNSTFMLENILSGYVTPQVLLFRNALLPRNATYASVFRYVREISLAAPEYVVISGTSEAAILARDPDSLANMTTLTANASTAEDSWFAVQTNYDRNVKDPPTDARRTAAEIILRQYGQDVASTPIGIFAALSTYPVHNSGTAYSAVMHVSTGLFTAFQRVSMVPSELCH
eukprot:g776.t1